MNSKKLFKSFNMAYRASYSTQKVVSLIYMNNQFSRLEALIGNEALRLLHSKKVLVFGIGGVGGAVVDALARSGIGSFTLVDNDVVSITNINRQVVANHSTIGQHKVDVMKEHILSINSDAKVDVKKVFYLPTSNNYINFAEFDYVVDAIDTVSGKIDVITKAAENNVPVISAMGCGNRLDPTKVVVTDIYKTSNDPLAKIMRKKLRENGIKHLKVVCSTELPMTPDASCIENNVDNRHVPGSSVFVPNVAGLYIASEIVKDLLK